MTVDDTGAGAARPRDVLLDIRDLHVTYRSHGRDIPAVRGIDLTLRRGEVVGLVGESGSGKSTIGRAVLGLHRGETRTTGSIRLGQDEIVGASGRELRRLRRTRVSLVPQDPLAALNPLQTIGTQISEALGRRHGLTRREVRDRVVDALDQAGIPDASGRLGDYPHQFSGGQRQRVLIAIALVSRPDLIIADEPTSALDVTVQRKILDNLLSLVAQYGTSLLLITHDLGVAADRTDRVVVLSDGRIVEQETSRQIFTSPRHPYTQALLASAPGLHTEPILAPFAPDPGGDATPLVSAEGLRKVYERKGAAGTVAVDDVTVRVERGQSLGLVGESGSGKTTVARILLGLVTPEAGRVRIGETEWRAMPTRTQRHVLAREVQPVFQDPFSSLDPSSSVGSSILEPVRVLTDLGLEARRRRLLDLLDQVKLPRGTARRKPYELSGGQLQRVAIARALSVSPGFVVLDEPVSALDVSVQDQVLRLLAELKAESGLSYLFISHDLAVVRLICHDVAVMRRGRVVESGPVGQVFDDPQHEYTRELIAAIPGRDLILS